MWGSQWRHAEPIIVSLLTLSNKPFHNIHTADRSSSRRSSGPGAPLSRSLSSFLSFFFSFFYLYPTSNPATNHLDSPDARRLRRAITGLNLSYRLDRLASYANGWGDTSRPPRVREVICLINESPPTTTPGLRWGRLLDCTERHVGGHHVRIGGFYARRVRFRITVTTRDDLFEKEVDFFSLLSGVSFLPLLLVSAVLRLPAGLQSPGELMQSPRWVLASYFSFFFF